MASSQVPLRTCAPSRAKDVGASPADSPDPNVKLTNEQMDFVKAQLESIQPVIKAKPKEFGCG